MHNKRENHSIGARVVHAINTREAEHELLVLFSFVVIAAGVATWIL